MAAGQMGINNAIFEFCMRHSDDPSKRTEGIPDRDKADYDWLKEALASIKTDGERMEASMQIVKESRDSQAVVCALEEIQYFVEDLDNALDFLKTTKGGIGGGKDILRLCGTQSAPEVRDAALHVVSTCAQNNPVCQKLLAADGVLPELLAQLGDKDIVNTRLFGALSALVRGVRELELAFIESRGAERVIRALTLARGDTRACKKGMFMLNAIWAGEGDLPPPPVSREFLIALEGFLGSEDCDLREMASNYLRHTVASPEVHAQVSQSGIPAAVQARLEQSDIEEGETGAHRGLLEALKKP
eukprot:TRINITY_DN39650_c0_g1_i1.p1 TRINITY_DN39650_c0_g1~~TRINITY_DN39650_c0_g1_i1.p1  ORF type:complete len:302 (+),score=102.89 TRINITY_DN39650_c0_g1_i1:88-993(+)